MAIAPLGQHLWDSQLGLECRVAVAADGVLRCLPLLGPALIEGEASAAAYADSGCRRALARYNPAGACGGPMPAMAGVARASQKRCLDSAATGRGSRDDRRPGRWDIHRLGRPARRGAVLQQGGACQPGPAAAGEEFYEMGAPLAPAGFVALKPE